MIFCSLKGQNLVLKKDLVNRRRVVYSRSYGISTSFHKEKHIAVNSGTYSPHFCTERM